MYFKQVDKLARITIWNVDNVMKLIACNMFIVINEGLFVFIGPSQHSEPGVQSPLAGVFPVGGEVGREESTVGMVV